MAHAAGPSRPNLTPIPNTNTNPNPNPSPSRPNPTTAQHRIESSKYTPAPTCPVLPILQKAQNRLYMSYTPALCMYMYPVLPHRWVVQS